MRTENRASVAWALLATAVALLVCAPPPVGAISGHTLRGTAPILIDGDNNAHDTNANRTVSIAPATQSAAGSESATDKGYADYLNYRWESVQARFLLSKLPQLTGFDWTKAGSAATPIGTLPFSTAGSSADGKIEGGGVTSNAGTTYLTQFTVFQTPWSGIWATSIYAKFIVPTSGHIGVVGIISGTGHSITAGSIFATSTSFYVMRMISSGTGTTTSTSNIAIDVGFHWLSFVSDSVNIKLYVDGVDSTASLPASAFTADEPMAINVSTLVLNDVVATKAEWGFIQP